MALTANLCLIVPNADLSLFVTCYNPALHVRNISGVKVGTSDILKWQEIEHLDTIIMLRRQFKLSNYHDFVGCTSMEYNVSNSFIDMALSNQTDNNQCRESLCTLRACLVS